MDLEKAFDRVQREVISWAMCKLGVEEWLVSAVVSMYTCAKTVVRTVYYRAMLCIRGTSHGPVSVCPSVSVTSRISTKMATRRITQTTLHYTPGTLVF